MNLILIIGQQFNPKGVTTYSPVLPSRVECQDMVDNWPS